MSSWGGGRVSIIVKYATNGIHQGTGKESTWTLILWIGVILMLGCVFVETTEMEIVTIRYIKQPKSLRRLEECRRRRHSWLVWLGHTK